MTVRGLQQAALDLAGGALWRIPGRFGIARVLGRSYTLRCIVFHDISAVESPFTKDMGVSTSPGDFEAALRFVTRYYTPVSLQDILADSSGKRLPARAILVTFDDGYASIMQSAVPLCRKFDVPAIFFINAAVLDNHRLAPDNMLCYAANVLGMETINAAVRTVKGDVYPEMNSMSEIFSLFFPTISVAERNAFLDTLLRLAGTSERELAEEASLYLSSDELRSLASSGFEIGNHTYTHVYCRSLTRELFRQEVEKNKEELEALTGANVRCFSLPYGYSEDLTSDMHRQLKLSGHQAAFLSESVANGEDIDRSIIDRVSVHAGREEAFFMEIEVLPRLRAMRNQLRRSFGPISNRRAPEPASIG